LYSKLPADAQMTASDAVPYAAPYASFEAPFGDATDCSLGELSAPEVPEGPAKPDDASSLGGSTNKDEQGGDEAGSMLLDPAVEPSIMASDTAGVVPVAPPEYEDTLGEAAAKPDDASSLGGSTHKDEQGGDEAGSMLLDPAVEPSIMASDTAGVVPVAPPEYEDTLGEAAEFLPIGVRVSVLWNEHRGMGCQDWMDGRVVGVNPSLGRKGIVTSHLIKYDNGESYLKNLLVWKVPPSQE
jgi:hypothetical protein